MARFKVRCPCCRQDRHSHSQDMLSRAIQTLLYRMAAEAERVFEGGLAMSAETLQMTTPRRKLAQKYPHDIHVLSVAYAIDDSETA